MGTYLIVFYLILWVIAFKMIYKRANALGPSLIIVASYVIYAIASILLYTSYPSGYPNISLFPFLYLFIMLLLALWPIIRYDSTQVMAVSNISIRVVYVVFSLFILSTIVVLPGSIAKLIDGFEIIFASDGGAADMYADAHADQTIGSNRSGGIVGYCNIVRYLLYEISTFLLFYYLTLKEKRMIVVVLISLAVFLGLIISLSTGLRTESTMSAFTILISFIVFRPFLSDKLKKSLTKVAVIVGGTFVFLTLIITIGRSLNRDGGAMEGIVEYVGQANLNFNEYALDVGGTRNGDRTLNYIKRMIGFDIPNSITGVRFKYWQMKMNDSIFSTFIGDFVLDFGPILVPFLCLFSCIIICNTTRTRTKIIRLDQLLIIHYVSLVCMHGGMYLYYFSFSGNFITLMYIIMSFVFRFSKTPKYSIAQR